MVTYETDGFQVFEDRGWFYPMQWSDEMQDMIPFIGKDEFEVRFSAEDQAIDFLAGK